LKGIKESRREIITEIYNNNYPPLRNFIIKNSGDEEAAKDAFQDVMMSLFNTLQKKDIEIKTSFHVYIFNVGKYVWFKKLRKVNHLLDISTIEIKSQVDNTVEEEEKYRLFTRQLQNLGPDCQKVLTYYFDRKSFAEIASLMNYKSETFARRKKYLCKKSLFNLVQADSEFSEFYN